MRKMRTIKESLTSIRESDCGIPITEYGIRLLCKENKIHNVLVGKKCFLDLDELCAFFFGKYE